MKKSLLLAAFAAAVLPMSAQNPLDEVNNLVANGNFEDTNYVQAVPEGYTWDPVNTWQDLSSLPGWTLSTGGIWNGTVCIYAGDEYAGDGDLRPEDDMQYLHFHGYNDNGWTSINASQIVKNLVPGRQYTLDFLIAQNQGEGSNGTPDPSYGFKLSEVDGDKAGKIITEASNMAEGQDMVYCSYTFTTPSDQVYLNFYLDNYYYEGNKKDDLWMDLDNVRIYSAEGDEETPSAVNEVEIDENAPVEYYNLQGVRVNAASDMKGIYIRKQGNKSTKVVL
ncbi:MAG: hypothetical protein K1W14_17870 [Muribaculaceae bacterium]